MTVLSKGDRGEAVKKLQTALNAYGCQLEVDGIFGDATYNAVISFQASRNLTIDGVVGAETWGALNKPTDTQLYNAFIKCLDAIETLPEFKTLANMLGVD